MLAHLLPAGGRKGAAGVESFSSVFVQIPVCCKRLKQTNVHWLVRIKYNHDLKWQTNFVYKAHLSTIVCGYSFVVLHRM
jgi:hypothetical protein